MSSNNFQITIVEQGWLEGCSPHEDLCSHGKIRLTIGNQSITDGDESYSISQSALALLRTLGSDHASERPVAERLIFCGCSAILMLGCPIGINWSVSHRGREVLINNVIRHYSTDKADDAEFSELSVQVPEEEYRHQIVAFAREAKELFSGITKTFQIDFDREQYESFWAEFDQLLEQYNVRKD